MDAKDLNPLRLWMDFCQRCDRVLRAFWVLREDDMDVSRENKKNCLNASRTYQIPVNLAWKTTLSISMKKIRHNVTSSPFSS
jgi:hypothetical protein